MWSLIIVAFMLYVIAGTCASIVYHRILSHRTLRLRPWFEYGLTILALPAGTPVQWVGTHRQHHLYTDTIHDPHSPYIHGFWYAHCGWYIYTHQKVQCMLYACLGSLRIFFDAYWRPRHGLEYNSHAQDVAAIAFYEWVSRPFNYAVIMVTSGVMYHAIFYLIWGITGLGVLWACFFIIYNLGDAVNSLGHSKHFDSDAKSAAINSGLLNFVVMGEGYHLKHHQNPGLFNSSARRYSLSNGIINLWLALKLARINS